MNTKLRFYFNYESISVHITKLVLSAHHFSPHTTHTQCQMFIEIQVPIDNKNNSQDFMVYLQKCSILILKNIIFLRKSHLRSRKNVSGEKRREKVMEYW